jgi:hypothetical protein
MQDEIEAAYLLGSFRCEYNTYTVYLYKYPYMVNENSLVCGARLPAKYVWCGTATGRTQIQRQIQRHPVNTFPGWLYFILYTF